VNKEKTGGVKLLRTRERSLWRGAKSMFSFITFSPFSSLRLIKYLSALTFPNKSSSERERKYEETMRMSANKSLIEFQMKK
jgi:hypothetical protein